MSAQNLAELSRAVLLLRKRLRCGEIYLTDNAKTVWQSDLVVTPHKLENVWTKFNRAKAEINDFEGILCAVLHYNFYVDLIDGQV